MNLHLDSRGRNTDPTLGGRDVYVTMKKEYLGWDTLLDTAILGTYNLLHCPNFYRNALGSWICICKKKRNQNHRGLSFLLSLPPCLPLPCPSFLSVINSTTITRLSYRASAQPHQEDFTFLTSNIQNIMLKQTHHLPS